MLCQKQKRPLADPGRQFYISAIPPRFAAVRQPFHCALLGKYHFHAHYNAWQAAIGSTCQNM